MLELLHRPREGCNWWPVAFCSSTINHMLASSYRPIYLLGTVGRYLTDLTEMHQSKVVILVLHNNALGYEPLEMRLPCPILDTKLIT